MSKLASKKIRIAVNGLGRIGRVFLRIALENPNFEIVGLHSRSEPEIYAHLLKYDSAYGIWNKEVECKNGKFVIGGKSIPYVQETEGQLPWGKMKVDLVVDASGSYTKKDKALKHISDGSKFVVTTAPMDDADETLVFGANHKKFNPKVHKVVSAASCTTVCSTLTIKVLEENFGVKWGQINTVHAITSDQSLLDSSHKDPRRARAAMESIIPTSSGVSQTINKLYPQLKGKISALSLRVPITNPSVVVLTAELKKPASLETLEKVFTKASQGALKGNLGVSRLPLVSVDFKGNPNGAVVDFYSSQLTQGKYLNLISWYDNEWGYVSQLVKLVEYLSTRIK